MDTDKEKKIFYLEELSNYKVEDSDKDVRGWEVKDINGRTIGIVDNLLVNKDTKRVVYLDVEVDTSIMEANYKPYSKKAQDGVHGFLNEEGENHLILPIGLANLNLDKEHVITKSIDHKTFAETKRMKKGTPVLRDYEILILDSYLQRNNASEHPKDDAFYERPMFAKDQ